MDIVDRIYRRLMMAIGRGRITTTDDSGAVQIVQIRLGADEVRDGTPRLAEYGFTSRPHPGADAVALFISGDRSSGVVIATGDQRYRLHLADGEAAVHDDLGQKVHLTRSGIVIDGGGLPIKITDTPSVRMETANLFVTGDITDRCDAATPRSMQSMRTIYDGHHHQVKNVQTGSSTINTEVPNEQE